MPGPLELILVTVWGVIVGLDFISVPQGLLSRPLVAATVAGMIAGSVSAGLMVGMVLELYALDVLPIGASRYPDYSVASVAAGVGGALAPDSLAVVLGALIGLPMAALGGWSLQALRRSNARSVQQRLARVAAGDGKAIWELQRNGMVRDGVRSFALIVVGLGWTLVLAALPWSAVSHPRWIAWGAIAGGVAAATGGAIRSAGVGGRRHWLAIGLATGSAVVLLLR